MLGDQHQGSCAVGICFNHSIRGGFLDDYLSLLTTGQRVPQSHVLFGGSYPNPAVDNAISYTGNDTMKIGSYIFWGLNSHCFPVVWMVINLIVGGYTYPLYGLPIRKWDDMTIPNRRSWSTRRHIWLKNHHSSVRTEGADVVGTLIENTIPETRKPLNTLKIAKKIHGKAIGENPIMFTSSIRLCDNNIATFYERGFLPTSCVHPMWGPPTVRFPRRDLGSADFLFGNDGATPPSHHLFWNCELV